MIEKLIDEVTPDGVRHMKMVSDLSPIPFPVREGAGFQVQEWTDELLGLHYLDATWASMDVVILQGEGWPKPRKLVLWKFLPGERVSEIIKEVADWYFVSAHHRPQYAFMKRLPQGAENGTEVDGCMLIEAEWALDGCVMIGG